MVDVSTMLNKAIEDTISESQVNVEIWLNILDILSKVSLTGFFTKIVSDKLSSLLMGNSEISDNLLDVITEFRYHLTILNCSDEQINSLIYSNIGIIRGQSNANKFISKEVYDFYNPIEQLVNDDIYRYLYILRLNITHFLRCISRSKAKLNN